MWRQKIQRTKFLFYQAELAAEPRNKAANRRSWGWCVLFWVCERILHITESESKLSSTQTCKPKRVRLVLSPIHCENKKRLKRECAWDSTLRGCKEEEERNRHWFVIESCLQHRWNFEKIGSPGSSLQKGPAWRGNTRHHAIAKSTRNALRRDRTKPGLLSRKQTNTQNCRFLQNCKPFQMKKGQYTPVGNLYADAQEARPRTNSRVQNSQALKGGRARLLVWKRHCCEMCCPRVGRHARLSPGPPQELAGNGGCPEHRDAANCLVLPPSYKNSLNRQLRSRMVL